MNNNQVENDNLENLTTLFPCNYLPSGFRPKSNCNHGTCLTLVEPGTLVACQWKLDRTQKRGNDCITRNSLLYSHQNSILRKRILHLQKDTSTFYQRMIMQVSPWGENQQVRNHCILTNLFNVRKININKLYNNENTAPIKSRTGFYLYSCPINPFFKRSIRPWRMIWSIKYLIVSSMQN